MARIREYDPSSMTSTVSVELSENSVPQVTVTRHTYNPFLDEWIEVNDVETNPQSIKADAGKPKLTLVPSAIIYEIAKIREYGLRKYGTSESWKDVDIKRYRDAAYRHFLAYIDDPTGLDAESGLPHLSHLACNIAFLCELEKLKK